MRSKLLFVGLGAFGVNGDTHTSRPLPRIPGNPNVSIDDPFVTDIYDSDNWLENVDDLLIADNNDNDKWLENIFRESEEISVDDFDGGKGATNASFGSNKNMVVRDCDIVPGDIKLGRGNTLQKHPGNVWFRQLIAENFDIYNALGKTQQTQMCKKILEMVKLESRQFWKAIPGQKGEELWVELDDSTARAKVAYTFRTERRNRKRNKRASTIRKTMVSVA